MNRQKLLRHMMGVTLVALLLVGCGAPVVTPTPVYIVVTATPQPTPIPPIATAVPPTSTPVLPTSTLTPTPVPPTTTPSPVPPTATCTPAPMATAMPSHCIAQDGEWEHKGSDLQGAIYFKVSNCKVIEGHMIFVTDNGLNAVFTYFPVVPIEDGKFSVQTTLGGGIFSVSGSFVSPTQAQGIYAVTKGSTWSGGITATKDISGEWSASPK